MLLVFEVYEAILEDLRGSGNGAVDMDRVTLGSIGEITLGFTGDFLFFAGDLLFGEVFGLLAHCLSEYVRSEAEGGL